MVFSVIEAFTYYLGSQLGCFSGCVDILELVCTYLSLEAGASAGIVRGIMHLRHTYPLCFLLSYCPMHYLVALIMAIVYEVP